MRGVESEKGVCPLWTDSIQVTEEASVQHSQQCERPGHRSGDGAPRGLCRDTGEEPSKTTVKGNKIIVTIVIITVALTTLQALFKTLEMYYLIKPLQYLTRWVLLSPLARQGNGG